MTRNITVVSISIYLFLLCNSCTGFRLVASPWLCPHQGSRLLSSELDEVVVEYKSTLKVPSTSWRWPDAWPFPGEVLELTTLASDSAAEQSTKVVDAYMSHYSRYSNSTDKMLRIGTKAILDITEAKGSCTSLTFEVLDSTKVEFPYESDSFDNVIVLSGVETLANPRDYYKEVWRVLKPGGKSMTFFTRKPLLLSEGNDVTKMWTTMNDEQKIWIAGSYFHYSAVGGWENVEGYDLLGTTGETMEFTSKDGKNITEVAYAVQSSKVAMLTLEDSKGSKEALREYFVSQLLLINYVDNEDAKFVSPRLATQYFGANEATQARIIADLPKLTEIYQVLSSLTIELVPRPVKAMLGCLLLSSWNGNPTQLSALRQSLGMDTAGEEFWKPISKGIGLIPPKEKIYFAADVVAKFGRDEYKDLLMACPALLDQMVATLKERFTVKTEEKEELKVEEAKIQMFAADMLVSDFLVDAQEGEAKKAKIMKFLTSYPLQKLEKLVKKEAEKNGK